MGMLGKGVGVLAKGIGSGTPSFVLQDQPDEPIIHPFRITTKKISEDEHAAIIRAGTVNNIVPTVSGNRLDKAPPAPEVELTGDGTHRIYINAEKGATPVFFPETVIIISDTSDKVDTDNNGYLLIGTVVINGGKVISVNQYVYASQVVVRAKPGDATALWLWSSR